MRLAEVVLAAAAFPATLTHLHAAVFVLTDFGGGMDVGGADGEQHQEREGIPDEETCGHVEETRHRRKFFPVLAQAWQAQEILITQNSLTDKSHSEVPNMDVSTINGLGQSGMQAPEGNGVSTPTAMDVERRRTLIQAVRAVNGAEVFGQENELSFAFDRASQRAVVRIVDRKTREVVQQIPDEKVLRMAEEIQQRE